MPEFVAEEVAKSAEIIVGGYAMERCGPGVRIANLHSGHVLIVDGEHKIVETSMDDLEIALAMSYLETNRAFLERS